MCPISNNHNLIYKIEYGFRLFNTFTKKKLIMDKSEVEQILIRVKLGEEEVLNMKVYKNGIVCRQGCGGVPQVGIGGMSFTNDSTVFDKLLSYVSQEMLNNPIDYQEENIDETLEYLIAFYGVSKNDDNGEKAEWTKSTGVRFLLDSKTNFRHPMMAFIDNFSVEAADLTNPWYFDIIIQAMYGFVSNTFPHDTMVTVPNTLEKKQEGFRNYVGQIENSLRKWDIFSFANGKTYFTKEGIELKPTFSRQGDNINFHFVPINTTAQEDNKNLWKVW